MTVCLDTLELTPEECEATRQAIRRMAHSIWIDAGQPEGADLDCWAKAERQWIENCYVPHRFADGVRPVAAK